MAKRNTRGVSTAQGNWSRIDACSASVQGMSAPPTKFTPRTNPTIPQLRNESAQPLSRGMKGRKNFTGTSYALPTSFGNAVQSVRHRRESFAESPAVMR